MRKTLNQSWVSLRQARRGIRVLRLPPAAVAFVMLAASCNDEPIRSGAGAPPAEPAAAPRAPADAIPESASISGASVTVGVSLGTLRYTRAVGSFAISRYPTTVAQYRKCVDADACGLPEWTQGPCSGAEAGVDGWTYGLEKSLDGLPVTCVSPSQASLYCGWVGGRLPTIDEWMLAVRGPSVSHYAWGDEEPSCDRHWRIAFESMIPGACCNHECNSLVGPAIEMHPRPLTPNRLGQILTTRAEMVLPSESGGTLGCGEKVWGCYVAGPMPAAIDTVMAFPNAAGAAAGNVITASFRCAWKGTP